MRIWFSRFYFVISCLQINVLWHTNKARRGRVATTNTMRLPSSCRQGSTARYAITAKLDGEDFEFETDGEQITADITALEENSSHTLEFSDEDGSLILSYPFSTRRRAKAAVSLLSENVGVDSVSLEFEITNPDGNEISVYYDGEEYAASVTENPYTATFNGLTIGEEHEIEFRDQDGSVIMTHSFSARERKPANVVITGLAGGFSTVTVSLEVDNPDNNQLELRINGQAAEIDFEAEEPYAVITGLDPRTDYTVSVTFKGRGTGLAERCHLNFAHVVAGPFRKHDIYADRRVHSRASRRLADSHGQPGSKDTRHVPEQ